MAVGAAEFEPVGIPVAAPVKLLEPVSNADGEPPRVALAALVRVAAEDDEETLLPDEVPDRRAVGVAEPGTVGSAL